MTEYRFSDGEYYSSVEFHEDREAADHVHQEGHRERLEAAAECLNGLLSHIWTHVNIVDFGCGNGGLSSLIGESPGSNTYVGFDICRANVESGQALGRDIFFRDFVADFPHELDIDIAVACEVLEHMQDPHGFLAGLDCSYLVCSVPNGETPENHPEYHVWGWDTEGFEAMLVGAGFRPIGHRIVQNTQVWGAVRD